MKWIIFLSLILLHSLCFAGQFHVTRVYDGDTFKAEGHDIEIKVRLIGIDAPETGKGKHKPGQPYSQKAKQFLTKTILNKTVDIKGYGMGPYNRQLCIVYLNGQDINLEMIRRGYAEVYQGKSPKGFDLSIHHKAEIKAKANSTGIWTQGEKYISPRDWRKRK